jgi:hypothetical protein
MLSDKGERFQKFDNDAEPDDFAFEEMPSDCRSRGSRPVAAQRANTCTAAPFGRLFHLAMAIAASVTPRT